MVEQLIAVSSESGRVRAGVFPMLLGTRLLRCGRTAWLQLHGVLNWRTADQFQRGVEAGLSCPCRRVVMDLTGVEYVGGDVLRTLMNWYEQLTALGIELRLVVSAGSRCARSLALSGLDRVIPTFTRPDQAWQHHCHRCRTKTRRRAIAAGP
jgi:anti-anti-sigma factor